MFCPHCGQPLPSMGRFCMYCGQSLPGARAAAPADTPEPAAPAEVPELIPQPAAPAAAAPAAAGAEPELFGATEVLTPPTPGAAPIPLAAPEQSAPEQPAPAPAAGESMAGFYAPASQVGPAQQFDAPPAPQPEPAVQPVYVQPGQYYGYPQAGPVYGNPQPGQFYGYAQPGQPYMPPYGYTQPPQPWAPPVQPWTQPPQGWNPPAPVQKKKDDPMGRAYRLTSLHTLVVYAIHSQLASVLVVLVGMILGVTSLSSLGPEALRGPEALMESLADSPMVLVITIAYALGYLGALLVGLLVAKSIRKRLPAAAPERRALGAGGFLLCAAVSMGLWMIGVLVGNFPSLVVPDPQSMELGWNSVPMWLVAIVVAPVFEELIFRKIVLDRVRDYGESVAVLTSALLFGIAHLNAGQFFLAFLLGLLFARVYLRTGEIRYTMGLHFMINTIATLEEVGCLIWGDGFDPWYLITVGALALVGLVLALVLRRHWVLQGSLSIPARQWNTALRCWPVTLIKWIGIVSIAATALLNAALSMVGDVDKLVRHARRGHLGGVNLLGLLYLLPAAGAVVLILILTRRRRVPAAEAAPVQTPPAAL